ncbi:polysaccharide biosynthesis/export family protein [Candidatus Poribacteria bacterium]|nr:polysaccharide biosynthesis/export family protein [Candidatus Poribacteria bacterium]
MIRRFLNIISSISLVLIPLLSPAALFEIKGVSTLKGETLKASLEEGREWKMILFLGAKPRYTWRVDPKGASLTLDIYSLHVGSKEVGFIPIGSKRLKLIKATVVSTRPIKARITLKFNSPIDPAAVRVENTLNSIILYLISSPPPKLKSVFKRMSKEEIKHRSEIKARKPVSPMKPTEYTIGPGDLIEVKTVWDDGDSESEEFIVDGEGQIIHPLLGEVKVGGQTTRQIKQLLQEALKKYLRNYRIEVSVKEYRSKKVLVVGEVRREGEIPWKGPIRLKELLQKAGGWGPKGDISKVELYPPGHSKPLIVDLKKDNPFVPPGSVVNVPPR